LSFLPDPPTSKVSYSDKELDATRAYIVLAHAEIEAFCENLALEKARAAKAVFDATGKVRPALRRIIAYHVARNQRSWSEVLAPTRNVAEPALRSYQKAIHDNHGIKRRNLEKMLFPIGVPDVRLNTTWLAQMDSFGSNRGTWAHQSARALNPPDPLSELTAVNRLLQGLLDLDRIFGRLR
jgi:hypothetical protein